MFSFDDIMPTVLCQPSNKRKLSPRQTDTKREIKFSNSLDTQAMEYIIKGAGFLSCGGGGPCQLGQDILTTIGGDSVAISPLDDVSDEAHVVVSGYIGSPSAAYKLNQPTFSSLERAINSLTRSAGISIDYVVPGEIGPVNSIAPLLAAYDLELPIVDADGCGRAVPMLAATTFGQHDKLITSFGAALANDSDFAELQQETVIRASNINIFQMTAGAIINSPAYGALGATALWMMTGKQLKTLAIPYGLSRSLIIGKALSLARDSYLNVVLSTLNELGMKAKVLCEGEPLVLESFTPFSPKLPDRGFFTLKVKNGSEQVTVYLAHENMYMFTSQSLNPVIMAPDMLCWLGEDGSTFDNSELQAKIETGKSIPLLYAIGIEATQIIGLSLYNPNRISFRNDPKIQETILAFVRSLGYGGKYIPFNAM